MAFIVATLTNSDTVPLVVLVVVVVVVVVVVAVVVGGGGGGGAGGGGDSDNFESIVPFDTSKDMQVKPGSQHVVNHALEYGYLP